MNTSFLQPGSTRSYPAQVAAPGCRMLHVFFLDRSRLCTAMPLTSRLAEVHRTKQNAYQIGVTACIAIASWPLRQAFKQRPGRSSVQGQNRGNIAWTKCCAHPTPWWKHERINLPQQVLDAATLVPYANCTKPLCHMLHVLCSQWQGVFQVNTGARLARNSGAGNLFCQSRCQNNG